MVFNIGRTLAHTTRAYRDPLTRVQVLSICTELVYIRIQHLLVRLHVLSEQIPRQLPLQRGEFRLQHVGFVFFVDVRDEQLAQLLAHH